MQPHRSFVLRCLPVRSAANGQLAWRFSLQEAEPDARRQAFNCLEDLVAFLRAELRCEPGAADRERER